ncbi:TetR family transcriptional regulator [Nocardioides flavescens]|uniref:TetR family transcriptional regulator n=1 Tax=Nocardioides flavescens TaxID=2691959 RepID=A0A6L7F3W1_9ACTN|nr:TetR family transcriptional regulator [Nocardioides flavescens]
MSAPTRSRLAPDERRDQLLELGVSLLADRPLEALTIDLLAEQGGISRGLLYHYFGSKQAFHLAVVRRAADDLIARTAPPAHGDPLERLHTGTVAYVDYVLASYDGYVSLVRGAAGGNAELREIYEEVRAALSDRIFDEDPDGLLVTDTPAHRLLVRGWTAMVEELVLAWAADERAGRARLTRAELDGLVVGALPALLAAAP